jgi:3',5'-cyclic AMP phosphodiesterase CpdA
LTWLADDLRAKASSTPIVVFAHIPLWTVYANWGWGTDESAEALSLLKRFGSVTVLNGHIHQIVQKVEGNITFHTARSTAFPQPAPGTAPSPGPMSVPAQQLRSMLASRQSRSAWATSPCGDRQHAGKLKRQFHIPKSDEEVRNLHCRRRGTQPRAVGATAASLPRGSHRWMMIAMPQRSTIAYAIVKALWLAISPLGIWCWQA